MLAGMASLRVGDAWPTNAGFRPAGAIVSEALAAPRPLN